MSYRLNKVLSLSGSVDVNTSGEELSKLFKEALDSGMHGLCFSAYFEGQEPGTELSEAQVRQRMEIIAPYTKWIRSFSCIEGNELIPKVAKEFGIKTLVGAWLGDDMEKNEEEIEGLLKLAKEGYVDIAAVGNEVLYRKDLTEDQLLDYIIRVKNSIGDVPVGYVDAYYEFEIKPRITEACDVVLANCYPFWEGCANEYALLYMKDMYERTKRAANGKKVIITETGWPSEGQDLYGAHPSKEGAMRYFINSQYWSAAEDIDIFYFSSFDEAWKTGAEGDVGAYWGLWDKDHNLKF
ncbi:MAG: glycosyl hydrolase [Bacteroidia bacterium]